ncbi:MAG: chitobiase/beta-hexosaminidase C-terminal domain-containing protein [Bacteroidota bacterium]
MKKAYYLSIALLFWVNFAVKGQQYASIGQIQLSPPEMVVDSIFFEQQTTVSINFEVPGVIIRYTINGEVPSAKSPIYETPLLLAETSLVQAVAFHEDFQNSESVEVQVYQITSTVGFSVHSKQPPSSKYPGNGIHSLVDGKKASSSFRDGRWVGFSADTVSFTLQFDQSAGGRHLVLSVLQDHPSWIFLPESVQMRLRGETIAAWLGDRSTSRPKSLEYIVLKLPANAGLTAECQIVMGQIPAWHDGAGTLPWFFIDEIAILKE